MWPPPLFKNELKSQFLENCRVRSCVKILSAQIVIHPYNFIQSRTRGLVISCASTCCHPAKGGGGFAGSGGTVINVPSPRKWSQQQQHDYSCCCCWWDTKNPPITHCPRLTMIDVSSSLPFPFQFPFFLLIP